MAAVALIGAHYLVKSHAEGTSSFILAPTTGTYKTGQNFTVTVSENSGSDQVNTVDMNLTYNASQLQFNSVTTGSSAGSPFTLVAQATGGSGAVDVSAAYPAGSNNYVTGTNVVATISFTMLATSGSAPITIASSSDILLASNQANDWNGTQTSASYVVALPPTVSITSPTASAYVHETQTITANATDNSGTGLSKVEFFGNGTLLGTDTSSPYSYSWNTLSGSYPDTKSYPLTAEAFDNAGDTTISSPVNVCINNGDVNNDGNVNATDLAAMANNWHTGTTYAQGNIDNQDGLNTVNGTDLSVLASNWNFSCE